MSDRAVLDTIICHTVCPKCGSAASRWPHVARLVASSSLVSAYLSIHRLIRLTHLVISTNHRQHPVTVTDAGELVEKLVEERVREELRRMLEEGND